MSDKRSSGGFWIAILVSVMALGAGAALYFLKSGHGDSAGDSDDGRGPGASDYRWSLGPVSLDSSGALDLGIVGECPAPAEIKGFRIAQVLLIVKASSDGKGVGDAIPCSLGTPPPESDLPGSLHVAFKAGPVPPTVTRVELSFVAWNRSGSRREALSVPVGARPK